MFSAQELEEFRIEATELLDIAEKSLLTIGSTTDPKEVFDIVFRSFHNMKGAAGMMEQVALQAHTHDLETTLMRFKSDYKISRDAVTYFLKGIDEARLLLSGQASSKTTAETATSATVKVVPTSPTATTPEDEACNEFFSECDEIIGRVVTYLQNIEAYADHTHAEYKNTIDALYRDFHSLKGSAYLFSFNQLGGIAHIIENNLEPIRDGKMLPSKYLINGIFASLKIIEKEIESLKNGKKSAELSQEIAELGNSLGKQDFPRDDTETLIQNHLVKSSIPTDTKLHVDPPVHAEIQKSPQVMHPQGAATAAASTKENESSSIRVPVSLLDSLMTLMGEMVLVRNQVLQFSNNSDDLEFSNLSKRLNAVTTEIQDEMMKTRMQPIGNILSKFTRVVRDLSQELGKGINLTLSGSETELDKSLLEAIKDPLTHIVRNSCDHGIESPEIRRKAGKPETGTIAIRSYHEGGQVVIEIADDGKGLSRDALLAKAVEKRIITESQGKQMSEKEVFNLIFAAGFSTAPKITNLSGRGVGMDVVLTNIEKIGGTVDLLSITGKGTTIRLKIPLTLAIVPALIVNSGGGIFAIPQVKLEELVRVDQSSENKVEYLQGAPVYRLRGSLLPLVDLNKVLGLKREEAETATITNIVVLNAEHGSFGLVVDEVQDTGDIVVKPLNRLLKSLQVYSGATILGDGSIGLILDVVGLSKLAQVDYDLQNADRRGKLDAKTTHENSEAQDYILVKLNSPTKHAIVIGYVHRLEEFKKSDIEYSGNRRVIRYRESLLQLVSANAQLGYKTGTEIERETFQIVVVEKAGMLFGIEVDGILDTLSSPVNPDTANRQFGIFGNLNTSKELIVIIDPFELIANSLGEKPIEPVEAVASPVRTKPLKILLAEDTVFFKKAISLVLGKAGHEVIYAADGQEAFELFNQNGDTFDIIVSDIEMPRMDGFGLARAVRAGKVNSQIPMLAISARASPEYVNKGKEAGFNIYMEKFKPDLLLRRLGELIGSGRKAA